ncbi:hypothetical protein Peur_013248 [Populus x canadensis]
MNLRRIESIKFSLFRSSNRKSSQISSINNQINRIGPVLQLALWTMTLFLQNQPPGLSICTGRKKQSCKTCETKLSKRGTVGYAKSKLILVLGREIIHLSAFVPAIPSSRGDIVHVTKEKLASSRKLFLFCAVKPPKLVFTACKWQSPYIESPVFCAPINLQLMKAAVSADIRSATACFPRAPYGGNGALFCHEAVKALPIKA